MPNTLYLSELLQDRHPAVYGQIAAACAEFGQEVKPLPHTRDIWLRDFMPVPLPDGSLLEYRYDPDYLLYATKGGRGSKSYPDIICDALGWKTTKTDLIMDGGNVIRRGGTLIMTDKVVKENQHRYNKTALIAEIKKQFQVDTLVLLPQDPKDAYGHTDSMVRFVDAGKVLVSYLYKDYKPVLDPLRKASLAISFLQLTGITASKDKYWPYLNFLQTDKLLLYTRLDERYDGEVVQQLEELFPTHKGRMRGIDMPEVIKRGGALNCVSWEL